MKKKLLYLSAVAIVIVAVTLAIPFVMDDESQKGVENLKQIQQQVEIYED
jgi:uncharacterized protein (DUF3084 family)